MPEPHLAVRVAAVGPPPGGDVEEAAAQDGKLVLAGEPAAVAVDLGMDAMPGLGPDGPVERGVREDQGLIRLRGWRRPFLSGQEGASWQKTLPAGSRTRIWAGQPDSPPVSAAAL